MPEGEYSIGGNRMQVVRLYVAEGERVRMGEFPEEARCIRGEGFSEGWP